MLCEAIEQAVADRIVEVPYYYMRARIRHQLGHYDAAREDWDVLRAIWRPIGALPVASPRARPVLHGYEAALVLALSVATEDRLRGDWRWQGRRPAAGGADRCWPGCATGCSALAGRPISDLLAWLDRLATMTERDSAEVELPEPNFVTIE